MEKTVVVLLLAISGLQTVPLGPAQSQNPVPVDFFKQRTQPSRRYFVDLKSGMVQEHVSEMQRRIGGFYTPPTTDQFRQGTQNSQAVLVDPKTGMVINPVGEMQRTYRYDMSIQQPQAVAAEPTCNGEVISGRCYRFFSGPQTFSKAEATCKEISPNGHLASVTSPELHSQLVFMVTEANNGPILTWLGGVVQADMLQWTDGSSWTYSDWMPGQPKAEKDKKQCLEMFKIGERWWSAGDCESKRAFICSHPVTA